MKSPSARAARWLLIGAAAACAAYALHGIDRGWIPNDAGTRGHSATRFLDGQLPHRDFDDVYTGGQALWHALVLVHGPDVAGSRAGRGSIIH